MLVLDLLWWVYVDRLLRRLGRAGRWLLGGFMCLQLGCLLLIIIGRHASDRADEWLPRPILADAYVWHFILLPIASVWMVGEVTARAIASLVRRLRPSSVCALDSTGTADPPPVASRRDLLRAAAFAAPPLLSFAATGRALSQLDDFRIRNFRLAIPALPEALDGLRIAHVSDIHIGGFAPDKLLRKIVDATNAMHADLVLYTGDLINHALSDLPVGLDLVHRLDARYGIFLCEGNHDLLESRAGFENALRQAGMPLLLNEQTMLSIRGADVQLLGLCWGFHGRVFPPPNPRSDQAIAQSMAVLLPQRRPEAFQILLAHHPHAFDLAADAGIPLVLAGHTHGGQLMAGPNVGFGPLMFRYWSGLYQKQSTSLIVSNGVGNWFPLRVNAPAEIGSITLHRAAS